MSQAWTALAGTVGGCVRRATPTAEAAKHPTPCANNVRFERIRGHVLVTWGRLRPCSDVAVTHRRGVVLLLSGGTRRLVGALHPTLFVEARQPVDDAGYVHEIKDEKTGPGGGAAACARAACAG
jgi:hypothetical protein